MDKKSIIILVLIAVSVILPIPVGHWTRDQGYDEGYMDGFRDSKFFFPARPGGIDTGISFDESTNVITVYYDRHTFREIAYYICQFDWDVKIPYTIIVYNNTMLEDWRNETDTIYYIIQN